MVQFMWI